jgi:gluconolactonase
MAPRWSVWWAIALGAFAAGAEAQIFEDLKVDRVASKLQFAEGPAWSQEGNFLLFSDVAANKLKKFVPGEGVETVRENTNGTNGNSYDDRGRLYSCESRTRRLVRSDRKGHLEVLADKAAPGKRFNAPNDLAVRKDGHVYFTDPAFGSQSDARDLDYYGVFHLTPKGELERIAAPKGRPNGIALSANGRTLYVTNSDERNVRAYDLDRAGRASNERIVIRQIEGIPDGLKLDEKGNLYIAAKGLQIWSPDGKLLHSIELPENPTNCAFGDPDYQTLYITARTSVYRVRLDVKGAVQY